MIYFNLYKITALLACGKAKLNDYNGVALFGSVGVGIVRYPLFCTF